MDCPAPQKTPQERRYSLRAGLRSLLRTQGNT